MRRRAVMSPGETGRMAAWGWGDGAGVVGVVVLAAGAGGGSVDGGAGEGEGEGEGPLGSCCCPLRGSLMVVFGLCTSDGRGGEGAYSGCFRWKNDRMDDCPAVSAVGGDITKGVWLRRCASVWKTRCPSVIVDLGPILNRQRRGLLLAVVLSPVEWVNWPPLLPGGTKGM